MNALLFLFCPSSRPVGEIMNLALQDLEKRFLSSNIAAELPPTLAIFPPGTKSLAKAIPDSREDRRGKTPAGPDVAEYYLARG